jgi:Fic family protein
MKKNPIPTITDETKKKWLDAFFRHPKRSELSKFLDNYPHWNDFIHRDFSPATSIEIWNYAKVYTRMHKTHIKIGKYDFYFTVPNILFEKLHKIDTSVWWTLITNWLIPKWEQDRYYLKWLIDESIASSQIEWAATTKKIAEAMIQSGRKPKNKDERMIINNFHAMSYVSKYSREYLTMESLLAIQSLVTEETLDNTLYSGSFRVNNEIVVADVITWEVLHTPPPYSELPELMDEFIKFFNHESHTKDFIHPIVRGIIIHFLIGWIHPFFDGNGRTARSLFHWYTLKQWYNLMPYLSVSQMILESKIQYGKAYLESESDENDLTYFILYNMRQLEKAWKRLEEHIQWNLQKQKKLREKHLSDGMNLRQAEIISWFEKERGLIITIQDASLRMSTPKPTIRIDIDNLVKMNKLRRININKKTYGYTSIN